MSFLAPVSILVAALAIPILLLYMLRLRRREVPISSTLLWQMLVRDREANAAWQRLRRNFLMILQLLALAMLVLALMRPYAEVPTVVTGRSVLLLDASASMNATDVSPSRFEAARQQALELVGTLGEHDSLAVIRVGETPEMVVNYTDDADRLRSAINSIAPGNGAADWGAALTLAAAGAQGAQSGENFAIILIGDGGLPPGQALSGYGELRFIPVGTEGDNLGIAALATGYDPVAGPQIFGQIVNYGIEVADVIFSIYLDGDLWSAAPYHVAASTHADVMVSGLPAGFQRVEARLSQPTTATAAVRPDYLAADDVAWAVYTPASAGRAVIFSEGNRFLEQGISSLPDWRTFRGDLARGLPGDLYDLYVFDGWLPPVLPDANLLIVNPPAEAPALEGLLSVGEETRLTNVLSVRPDDPRTRYLNFAEVNILQFRQITEAPWADVLVEAAGGPLVLAGDYEGRRIAVIPFDLFDSDLPLKIAWPILLANLTEWYKAPRAVAVEGSLVPGQTVPIQVLTDTETLRVTRPDGYGATFNADRALLIYADTHLPGIYTVALYEGESVLREEAFAVNLFDVNESQIAPRTVESRAGTPAAASQQEIGQQELWHWVALLGLLVLALEWFLYHRRISAPRIRPDALFRFARRG